MDVIYCEEKHGPREGNPDVKETYHMVRGNKPVERAIIIVYECRMGYGYRKKFHACGDWTDSMDPVLESILKFDRNGVPKMFFERNHPRIV